MFRQAITRQARLFSSTPTARKSVVDSAKDVLNTVNKTVSQAAVKGIETGESATQAVKETVGANSGEISGKAQELKGAAKGKAEELKGEAKGAASSSTSDDISSKASELAGAAKGKANELTGAAKGKANEVKGKM